MANKQEWGEGDRLWWKKSGLLFVIALSVANETKEQKQKNPHQRAFMSLWSRGSLRIFFVPSPSGRCPADTANLLLLLVMYYHCPIMIDGLAGVEPTAGMKNIEHELLFQDCLSHCSQTFNLNVYFRNNFFRFKSLVRLHKISNLHHLMCTNF